MSSTLTPMQCDELLQSNNASDEVWPTIAESLIKQIEHIKLNWGSHDELVTFWLTEEFHNWGDPVDHIAERYDVSLAVAQQIYNILSPYSILFKYND